MLNSSLSFQNVSADLIAHYTQQIEAYPELLSNYWHLGLAWLLLGNETEAQTVWFSAITAVDPETIEAGMAELLGLLAIAAQEQLQLGKFYIAEQIYLQMLDLQMLEIDATVETFLSLGSAVSQQGRYEEAIAHWQSAINLQPNLAVAYQQQAEVWQKLEQWREAIAAYTQAIYWHSAGQATGQATGQAGQATGQAGQATGQATGQAGQATGQTIGQMHSAIGWCLGQQGDWQTAETQFRQALTLAPENSGFYGDLGWALLQQQNWAGAIVSFQQAVWLESQFAPAYCAWVESLEQPSLRFNAQFLTLLNPDRLNPDRLNPDSWSIEIYQALENLLRGHQEITQGGAIASPSVTLTPIVSSEIASTTPSLNGIYRATYDWFTSNNSEKGRYIPLDPPHLVSLTPPKTLEAEIHFSFRFGEAIALPETFVAEIPQGRFWLSAEQTSSAVIASDYLLSDLSPEFPLLSPNHPDRLSGRSALTLSYLPVQKISGTVAVLSGLANDLYFHWMLDVLPRWALLQRSGIDLDSIDGFVVSDLLPFQAETLAILGVPSDKIITGQPIQAGQHIQADRLIVPSYPGSPAWMPQWVCPWLQRLLFVDVSDRLSQKPRSRLYISRSQATYRRVINELEIMDLLEPLGFQSVTLESLSVRAQAELMSRAEVVISPHGGGLTNLAFCQAGTQVIEFFAPRYVYPCYWFISNLGRLEYAYLVGKTPMGGLHQLLYTDARTEDIWIDLEKLRSLLHHFLPSP